MFCNQEFEFNKKDFQDYSNMNDYMDNKNFSMQGVNCPPICECPIEKCCTRDIHHCVEHIVPINTKIINHHIYHHVYKPVYTCSEENICSNDPGCMC